MNPLQTELAQFTGSTQWFRHAFNRAVIFTDGVHYLAEQGQAWWLIDAIASHLGSQEFQGAAAVDHRIGLMHFWKLAVRADRTATLKAIADWDERPFIQQEIPFTDFPLEEIDIWAHHDDSQWTLLLPSEY